MYSQLCKSSFTKYADIVYLAFFILADSVVEFLNSCSISLQIFNISKYIFTELYDRQALLLPLFV